MLLLACWLTCLDCVGAKRDDEDEEFWTSLAHIFTTGSENDNIENLVLELKNNSRARSLFFKFPFIHLKLKLLKLLKSTILVNHILKKLSESGLTTTMKSLITTPDGSGKDNSVAVTCYDDNDLFIAIDSSSSIGNQNYATALQFANQLAVAAKNHSGNQISVYIFSHYAERLFGLNESLGLSCKMIEDKILGARYHAGGTEIHTALDSATMEFQSSNRSFTNEIPRNVVILSDGVSNLHLTQEAAEKMFSVGGVRGFTVAIGDNVDDRELLAITGNKTDHMFHLPGFDDLLHVLRPLSEKICEKD